MVAVLRGGPSSEYDVSLKTGASVLNALDRDKYDPRDVFVSRSGEWHLHGVPVDPERALRGVDVAFNAMHGEYGEDGQVQRLLERLSVPYTGSSALASAVAFNKQHTKERVAKLGVKVAHGMVLERPDDLETVAHQLFRSFPQPAIVKPVVGTGSRGVAIAENYHALESALRQAFDQSPQVLIEEYIRGRDATVGIINNFRKEPTYALIPLPHDRLSPAEKEALVSIARIVHDGLELSQYSTADFVVAKRGIYFIEVNTHPKFHEGSLLHEALATVGASFKHFVEHVLELANTKKSG